MIEKIRWDAQQNSITAIKSSQHFFSMIVASSIHTEATSVLVHIHNRLKTKPNFKLDILGGSH